MTWSRDRGSFRDPSGFVFVHGGTAYRQVNAGHASQYRLLMESGLYASLSKRGLLVAHEEVPLRLPEAPPAAAVLRPQQIPFISYPYEWCFSQLKAAALLTLDIQRRSVERNLTLRDASAFNVQFLGTRPIFIDTLSFGPYEEGRPWPAYRQFCQHFLAPLALMAMVEPALGDLARLHSDGIPLAVATATLPFRSRCRPGLLMHLHLHSRAEVRTRHAPKANGQEGRKRSGRMGRRAMFGLIDSLERTVDGLVWKPPATLWSTYAAHMNYTETAQQQKLQIVGGLIDRAVRGSAPATIWDFGANTGVYSRLAADTGARVVAFDADRSVVERHFVQASQSGGERVLPLVQDLAHPSPALGWNLAERHSLVDRGPADVVLALALIHHLAIGCNVPLPLLAEFFGRVARRLIVEFVPRHDSQVQRMVALREDVFDEYSQERFERAFAQYFAIRERVALPQTVRVVYLMDRKPVSDTA